jgi:hypothetical protein
VSRSLFALGALVGLLCLAATLESDQRDQAMTGSGTATISGVVEIAGTSERVKAAVVTLFSARGPISLNAITDGDGRFVFERLPIGTYGLSARRPSFVSIPYGASRPGRAGLPISLGDGQRLSDLRVQLARGSVITGMVRDESGAPVPDMEVRVQRLGGGQASAQAAIARTSHRGEYRVFGLQAGSYVVSTRLSAAPKGEFEQPSTAEVDAALRRVELRRSTTGAIGPPASGASGRASPVA